VPTLPLWGEQDALVPREEQERLAATPMPRSRSTPIRVTLCTGSAPSG
jgi:hypothetical protein